MASLLIVDGDNLAHRAYHSTPSTIKGTNGEPINAMVGFFSMLSVQWKKEQPRGIFVAWDTLGVDTYRNKLWPAYQSGRVFDPEIVEQLGRLPALCLASGMGVGQQAGYEADDLIASAVRAEVAAGGTCLVLTTDKDSYQLASDKVTILSPVRGSKELDRIGPMQVVERFGILPEQVPDFKALAGDASDKIPGAKGIGPKAAASLLLAHGNLDGVVAAWDRHSDTELVQKFKEVATMRHDAQVELPKNNVNWSAAAEALRALGASNAADRLELLA